MSWYSIPKRQGHTKNVYVKTALNDWILQQPQVVESPIAYIWVKVTIEGQY